MNLGESHTRANLVVLAVFCSIAAADCTGSSSPGDGGQMGVNDANPGQGGAGGLPCQGGAGNESASDVPGAGGADSGGSTSPCGAPGYTCCAGNSCNNGGCCVSDICMAPGGVCSAALGGGTCNAGACGNCGGPGLPCCGADPKTGVCTAASTVCASSGTCAKCGELGIACCAGATPGAAGTCSAPGTLCSNNFCVPCGVPGSACCAGNQCGQPACCYDNLCVGENGVCGSSAGTCKAGRCSGCGVATQPCCNGTCYDGLLCTGGTCTSCGHTGEPCCQSSTTSGQCQSGLACSGTGSDGRCARCGQLGDICCVGSAPCADGCCSGGRCLAGVSCAVDASVSPDLPVGQCASGGAPCSALAHFTGTQVVDGKDDEFCNIPSFELNFTNAAKVIEWNTATGRTYPERAVVRVGWDDKGIHAFFRVYDTNFTPAALGVTPWNGDGVEIFFTTSKDLTGFTQEDLNTVHVIASPPVVVHANDSAALAADSIESTPLPAGQFATGSDTTGYWVELDIPWVGPVPTAGSQIRLDFQLNSADGPRALGDSYVRDAEAIFYMATVPSTVSDGSIVAYGEPYDDDLAWCTSVLSP